LVLLDIVSQSLYDAFPVLENLKIRRLPLGTQFIQWIFTALLTLGGLTVLAIIAWYSSQSGFAIEAGNAQAKPLATSLNISILVFREGLECILVLSAIMASMTGAHTTYRRPIAWGVLIGCISTVVTWYIAVGLLNDLMLSVPALDLQAATGLIAILVLLVVMNWFFHKVYWGGWISLHQKKKQSLITDADKGDFSKFSLWWGLGLLGFSSLYREGFEVVLFLQSYRMSLGGKVVLQGVLVGLTLTAIVAVLTFVLHHKLPYRKMLILTGMLLGLVLLVMVGEEAQEMQLAHWIPTTELPWLKPFFPDWMGLWFAMFPTFETLIGQLIAAILVAGSYAFIKFRKYLVPTVSEPAVEIEE